MLHHPSRKEAERHSGNDFAVIAREKQLPVPPRGEDGRGPTGCLDWYLSER